MFFKTCRRGFGIRLAMTAFCLTAALAAPGLGVAQAPVKTETRKVMSSEELYEHTLRGTCWITVKNTSGTGWVLNKEKRLVVTNDHVVEGTDMLGVYFPVRKDDSPITDPNWYKQNVPGIRAVVIDRDKRADLALLQLDSIPNTAAALPVSLAQAKQR